ncbi:hypothetical protein TSTA_036420 [Talaromyces stipitatus ATCC 10500]|uniref:Uncharacterized protein n=1 Tax=Talaromyces stipitatus (strain ATCC 10500 / CBS 375.48 / QM 6759 / NRRL 1006) TaxID=441959 RepID=B8M8A3_TALSN|nr:uncharacterized protein TSTA_036420 [Talaromyces stipitatus ATCC 10500]EED20416.1 hypothetical protein TSTA_036420 [Talaromyces stipitatus ATCC 10500]
MLFHIVLADQDAWFSTLHITALNTAHTLAEASQRIKYKDIDKHLYKPDSYTNVVRNLSGLFFVIREDYVYFIHPTAREFLLINNGSSDRRANHQWKGRVNMEYAHGLMWSICLSFLPLCPDHLVETVTKAVEPWTAKQPEKETKVLKRLNYPLCMQERIA